MVREQYVNRTTIVGRLLVLPNFGIRSFSDRSVVGFRFQDEREEVRGRSACARARVRADEVGGKRSERKRRKRPENSQSAAWNRISGGYRKKKTLNRPDNGRRTEREVRDERRTWHGYDFFFFFSLVAKKPEISVTSDVRAVPVHRYTLVLNTPAAFSVSARFGRPNVDNDTITRGPRHIVVRVIVPGTSPSAVLSPNG